MAIFIKHRFIERLSPTSDFNFINTIIIGTFNPGLPDKAKLTHFEKEQFDIIEQSKKFRKFNSVMNFYDGAPNRFWGIMDRIHDPAFYDINGFEARNKKGLKHYSGTERIETFKRQQEFCVKAGIFITDLVKDISPKHFGKIYDNFPDTQIEISNPTWNTEEIIATIEKFKPKRVLINFSTNNNSISKIATQALQIKNAFHSITFCVLSTSGAAGNKYRPLLDDWAQHIYFKIS